MLELRDLSRRYGDTVALDGLTLEAPTGEVVGFVGPNGAGKTTAMRIALGVLEADAGEVLWNGAPATREAQRTFGYMPEERGLYPKMRVDRQLRLPGRAARPARRTRPRRPPRAGSSGWASPSTPSSGSRSSRSATSSASSWPPRWSTTRTR